MSRLHGRADCAGADRHGHADLAGQSVPSSFRVGTHGAPSVGGTRGLFPVMPSASHRAPSGIGLPTLGMTVAPSVRQCAPAFGVASGFSGVFLDRLLTPPQQHRARLRFLRLICAGWGGGSRDSVSGIDDGAMSRHVGHEVCHGWSHRRSGGRSRTVGYVGADHGADGPACAENEDAKFQVVIIVV